MPSPLSISQVIALPTGTWINDGFTAVVRSIEQKTAKPPKNTTFWVCLLGDAAASSQVEMAVFTAPKFREGDRIDVTGNGIKFESGRYGPKVSIGRDTVVSLVGTAVRSEGQPVPRSASPQGGGGGGGDFDLQMKRIIFLYCHADSYALRAQDLCGNRWSPDELQACRSSIFIEACRRNLIDIVPPLETSTDRPKSKQPPAEDEGEDVPF